MGWITLQVLVLVNGRKYRKLKMRRPGGICRYVEDYGQSAGYIYGEGQSLFAKWREAQNEAGHVPWLPYNDLEEWDPSEWLLLNVGQNTMDKYLKLPIVS